MPAPFDGFLFVYFANGIQSDAEQIRFAVSHDHHPRRWKALAGGRPILRSSVGEGGVRDPFIIRDERTGEFIIIATDLRAVPRGDWDRAVRHGSTSILVWRSTDLIRWDGPTLTPIAPTCAGNAWAPKAVWSNEDDTWLVFFASALYEDGDDRSTATHQRILVTRTQDFRSFAPARVDTDPGHDVIDAAFLTVGGQVHRFSADSLSNDPALRSQHVTQEVGSHPTGGDFTLVANNIDAHELVRGEGPAPFPGIDGDGYYLLVDEFELRGYHLFHTDDPSTGRWDVVPDVVLPAGARHGSVIPITSAERVRLLEGFGVDTPSRTSAADA